MELIGLESENKLLLEECEAQHISLTEKRNTILELRKENGQLRLTIDKLKIEVNNLKWELGQKE